jgi:hypothetical protein
MNGLLSFASDFLELETCIPLQEISSGKTANCRHKLPVVLGET